MLNIAVVGCGYWGPNLVRNFNAINNCRVKTICDLDKKRLTYISSLYPAIQITTNFDDIVEDDEIDAVAVATPVYMHHTMAKRCLVAGKHTFIEKPMAASVRECVELVEIAQKNGLILMVGHTFIYTPPVRKIKELVKRGEIGEVFYISSRRLNLGLFQKDINVAWDLAPHDISIILYIMDQSPIAVNCQGKCHINPGIEDVVTMTLDFENGGFAIINNSWLDPNKVREMTIVGSKKMVLYNDTEPIEKIKIYDKRVEVPPHYDTFAEFHFSYHYGDIHTPYLKQEEPLRIECQHFLDCINTKTTPETNGLEGLAVVRILEAVNESLKKNGERIKLAVS